MFTIVGFCICLPIFVSYIVYTRFFSKTWKSSDDPPIYVVIPILALIAFSITGVVTYGCGIDWETKYEVSNKRIVLAQERAEELLPQLKTEVSKYLNHEASVLNSLSPKNASILLVQYPQLRSSEAVVSLLKSIEQTQNLIYEQKQEQADLLSDIYFAQRNVFFVYKPDVK